MLLLVMGMGRSGTSLLMQTLHAAGFDCGSDWIADNENNPRGYFERKSVMSFNIYLLQKASGDTESLYPMPDEESIDRLVGTPIPVQFPSHDYAVKDPRFSLTFPVWYPYLTQFDLRVVLSRRNEEAIVESMARAYDVELKEGREIVRRYIARAERQVDRFGLRTASVWYEDWFNNPEKNVAALEELIGRPLNVDLGRVLDKDLQHCRGEVLSVSIDDLNESSGIVPLKDIQSDRRKENILAIQRRWPRLAERIENRLKESTVEIKALGDGAFQCWKQISSDGERVEWTIEPPCSADGALCERYRNYVPQKQWLLHIGIDSLCASCLERCRLSDLSPVLIVEPDFDVFLSYLAVRSFGSLVKADHVRLYIGEEAFADLLRDLGSELEPYFITTNSAAPVVSDRCLKAHSSIFNHFRTRFQQIFQKKTAEVQQLRKRFFDKHRTGAASGGKTVAIVIPDAICWVMLAEGLAEGYRSLQYKVTEHVIPFPFSAVTPFKSLRLLLDVYRSCPDYLVTISHPSDVMVWGIRDVPIKRFVWYVDEPDHLFQLPHGLYDYVFSVWREFEERLAPRGGHLKGEIMVGGRVLSARRQDSLSCDVCFVGTVHDTSSYRAAISKDILDLVDKVVDAKIEHIKTPLSELFNRFGLSADGLKHIVRTVESGLRKQGMTDLQLVTFFLHMECIRKTRVRYLSSLHRFDLKVFGNPDWELLLRDTPVSHAFQKRPLSPDECRDLYRTAAISLNIHSPFLHSGPNLRDIDVPMCGGFVLSDLHLHAGERLREFFEPGVEIALYEREHDLPERVGYYLAHSEERRSITEAAQQRIKRDYNYRDRVQEMLARAL